MAVREKRNQFQTLANLSPIGLFRTDAEGQFTEVNQHWCEMAGLTPSAALGEGWLQTVHPDDRERVFRDWYAYSTGVSEKKGGETIQQTRGRGDAGTRRMEIPHKISLTHSTERNLPLGLTRGREDRGRHSSFDYGQLYRHDITSYGNKSIEYRLLHPDGNITWVLAEAVAQRDTNGIITGYIGNLTDISDRKQLAEQLQDWAGDNPVTGFSSRAMFLHQFEELRSKSCPVQLETELREALKNYQDFVVRYQPIFALGTGEIQGLEARVRWQHPTRGLVFPQEFIPLAQATGLIISLEQYILSQAAQQLRLWQLAFPNSVGLTMSLHLSPQQFSSPGLIEHIEKVLQETGLQGSSFNLEITESTLLNSPEEVIPILLELRNRGISVSVDHLDRNYSCLSQLAYLPINTLKIHRSLIEQMGKDTQEDSLVSNIINLADNLGLAVVAEGVETQMQLERLKQLQCAQVQGYLLSNVLEVEAITALLASSALASQHQTKITKVVAPVPSPVANSLEKELLKLAQRERLLKRRLASQIRNSLDFNTILKTAIQEIRYLFRIDCCQFFWYCNDVEPPRFEPISQACQLKSICSSCIQTQTPAIRLLGETLLEKKLLRIDNLATDVTIHPEIRDFLQSKGLKSLLAITIHPNSGPAGVIVCEHNHTQHHWQEEEVELLSDMAEQLVIAIDHAKLYEETRIAAAVANAQAKQTQKAMQELQQTQAQLIQTEKMSSLGLLVAGVAHEINNPVNFISGNIEYAKQYTQNLLNLVHLYQQHYPQPVAEIAELSEAIELDFVQKDLPRLMASMAMGTQRIQVIVQSLRNFSRLDEARMKLVNIHEGIDSTLLILQNQLKAKVGHPGIEIIKEYGDLPLVECYAGQLNQVFLNILSNAVDALENHDTSTEPHQITIRTAATPSNFVTVSIQDNGPGINKEVKKRLFDPFFTTKPVGKGTGLGLSISYQIVVEKHQGQLECISFPGKGTEFRIIIPVN
ncbi:MAG: EAL domain-containing protein [Symploca sp. SIO2E6]|nr:EAL domain-containing protein [Symploca sp. SIO2E6]